MNTLDRAKYRAKRIDNGEFVIGFVAQVDNRVFISDPFQYISEVESGMFFAMQLIDGFEEVDPETVGQFTGLKDTFGGDIIEDENGNRAVISWSNDQAGFCLELIDPEYPELMPMDRLDWKLKIIGNIHDNPELLEATS